MYCENHNANGVVDNKMRTHKNILSYHRQTVAVYVFILRRNPRRDLRRYYKSYVFLKHTLFYVDRPDVSPQLALH